MHIYIILCLIYRFKLLNIIIIYYFFVLELVDMHNDIRKAIKNRELFVYWVYFHCHHTLFFVSLSYSMDTQYFNITGKILVTHEFKFNTVFKYYISTFLEILLSIEFKILNLN